MLQYNATPASVLFYYSNLVYSLVGLNVVARTSSYFSIDYRVGESKLCLISVKIFCSRHWASTVLLSKIKN